MNQKQTSLTIYQKVVEGYSSILGQHDFSTLIAKQNLANIYKNQKDTHKAIELFQQVNDSYLNNHPHKYESIITL